MSEWDCDAFGSAYIILIMLLSELRLWTEHLMSIFLSEWVIMCSIAEMSRAAARCIGKATSEETRLNWRSEPTAKESWACLRCSRDPNEAWAAQEDEGWLSTTTWCWWENYTTLRGGTGATTRPHTYPTSATTRSEPNLLGQEKFGPTFWKNRNKSQSVYICHVSQIYAQKPQIWKSCETERFVRKFDWSLLLMKNHKKLIPIHDLHWKSRYKANYKYCISYIWTFEV